MRKKIIGLIILIIFLGGGGFFYVMEIAPEIKRIKDLQEKRANAPTYQERLDAMTLEDCESVSSGSPPEVRDRCIQIWRYASP